MKLKTAVYPILAVILVGALVYFRPARPGAGPDLPTQLPEPEVVDEGIQFVRTLPIPRPPETAIRLGVPEDRVQRWFERLLIVPSRIVFHTQEQLSQLDEGEQRRFLDLYQQLYRENPGRAAVAITALGSFSIPEAEEVILAAALSSDNRVRSEAVRALTILDSPGAALRAAELLDDPVEMVRRTAIRALIDMETPEALDVLEKYAARDPEDGMRHVLTALAGDGSDPGVIPILRANLDRPDSGSLIALRGLARFGDGVALDRAYEMLKNPDFRDVAQGVEALMLAPPDVVDTSHLEGVLNHNRPEVRHRVSELLGQIATAEEVQDRADVIRQLEYLLADKDLRVRHNANMWLYRSGRRDLAEPFLKLAATAEGYALHSTVDMLTRVFKDERAATVLLDRLAHTTNSGEIATILGGLGELDDPESLDVFIGFIGRAHPGEEKDGNKQALSRTASMHVVGLGEVAVKPLLAIISDPEAHEIAKLRALDALRGIGEGDFLESVVEISLDPSQSHAVRVAALESLPHLQGQPLYGPLSKALGQFEDRELGLIGLAILFGYS